MKIFIHASNCSKIIPKRHSYFLDGQMVSTASERLHKEQRLDLEKAKKILKTFR